MTLTKDLILSDQQVPSVLFSSTVFCSSPRPQSLNFGVRIPTNPCSPIGSPFTPDYVSPLSPVSPLDFLMGEAGANFCTNGALDSYNPLEYTQIKTEPVDNQFVNCSRPALTSQTSMNSANNCLNNNNNSTVNAPAQDPTDHAMSLTELDQLLNSDLTFYEELRLSGIVKSEPVLVSQTSMATDPDSNQSMDYDSDHSDDSDCSDVIFSEVQSEIVRQVKNDIRMATSVLDLHADPKTWSIENVQNWIIWTLKHYNLGVVENLDAFRLTGPELLSLSEMDFKTRSPQQGATLYAQLDMWQNAASLEEPTPTGSPVKSASTSSSSNSLSSLSRALPHPTNPLFTGAEQRKKPQHVSPTHKNIPIPSVNRSYSSSSGATGETPLSPDPLSPTDSTIDSTSFGSSVSSSCGSDDESEAGGRQTIHLWQFLKMLLLQPQYYGNCIRWLDRKNGIFKIEDSQRVAKLWGKRKNRPAMNYDKLSRSIRQYYKKGIIKKTENSKRLVYRFCHPYLL